jgi:hypothetical protein
MTKIENVLNEKPSVVQVESMIADAIYNNDKSESKQICDDDIVASINCKVSEIRESVQREKSIIIHGIKESQETEAIDRKRDDTNIVVELCEFVNVDVGIIKKVVRLGKRNNGDKNTAEENTDKSCPVNVTLSDIEGKQMLMKNLSKLKHAPEHSQLKKNMIRREKTGG